MPQHRNAPNRHRCRARHRRRLRVTPASFITRRHFVAQVQNRAAIELHKPANSRHLLIMPRYCYSYERRRNYAADVMIAGRPQKYTQYAQCYCAITQHDYCRQLGRSALSCFSRLHLAGSSGRIRPPRYIGLLFSANKVSHAQLIFHRPAYWPRAYDKP